MYAYLYALSVIGFMLKGLPILHFSGFALLIIHGMYGNWKLLYHKKHLIPLITAIGVLVLYFSIYTTCTGKQATPSIHW